MKEAPALATLSVESLISEVTDEFMDRLDRGERPEIEEYALRHPQLAAVLRQVLPALQMLRASPPDPAALSASPASGQPTPGCLGDYRILGEVGRGGMGVVYEAEQISLARRVALKVLPFAATLDAKQLQRFKNEAQAAGQLHHQNIVPVYGIGCERGVHYYAMQFIDGQTLAAMIAVLRQSAGVQPADQAAAPSPALSLASELATGRWAPARRSPAQVGEPTGPFTPSPDAPAEAATPPVAAISTEQSTRKPAFFRTVASLGVQAAEALEHAHGQGVMHRDIKPANLLVDLRGKLWITDFGLAHCQNQAGLTMTGDLVGTLRYMSPEQALAQRVVIDHRTDIYSLGVTLYELLALEPVFGGQDRQQLLRQIAFEEPRPPRRLNKAIPAELETIVLKAMEKNPAERYAKAQELADDLERFLKDEPIRARRPWLWQKVKKWARRNQAVVRTALVALAVLLVAVTVVATSSAIRVGEARKVADQRAVQIQRNLERVNAANGLADSARFHADWGDWAKADGEFTQAVQCGYDNSYVWLERGQFYARRGLWDLAAADFAMALQLQEPGAAPTWLQHALLRLQAGDRNRYCRLCQGMNELFGETTDALTAHQLVRACSLVSDPVVDPMKLLRLAELALAKNKTAWNLTSLATAHYNAGQYREALRFIGESQALDSSFERVWNCAILAMAHHRLGEADLARQKLNEATAACNQRIMDLLRSGPGLPTHWWDMLESSLHYREAKTLIDGFPPADDPRLWVVRGRNLVAVGRDEQAAASFSKALELQPTFEAAQADLVHAYQRLGRQDKVLAECLREVELEPKNAIALNRLAWVLANCPEVQFRDPGRAVVLAQQAISLVPVSAQGMYWNTLGVAHYRAGEWEAAGTALHKSLELRSGGNLNDWFFLAMAHWNQDQGDLARHWFAHAVQQMATTAPDNEDLRRYRAEAALLLSLPESSASTSRQLAQDDVALYTLVLKADRDAGWAFMLRGSALAELEQWQQAAADFAEATRRRPDDAKLWYDQAAAQLGTGNMEAYREVRAGMLRRFGKTTYPGIASLLLYISIVLPADASESAQLMQWGNLASRPGNEGLLGLGYERVHAAALYRAGKYGEAIEMLDRAARLFPRRAWDWLFLAMAYHHLGKPALAQEHLKNGLKWIEQAHQQEARGDRNAWLRWPEQVEVEQLRREAESLIQSTPGLRK